MGEPLRFVELIDFGMLRDGGSYEGELRTSEGATYVLGLLIDGSSDARPRRYATLHEGLLHRPTTPAAIPLGSPREAEILAALDAFLAAPPAAAAAPGLDRLRELRAAIPQRTDVPRELPPPPPLILVATLTIVPGRREAFQAYEAKAAAILARHGGSIERTVYIPGEPEREVHVVRFPDAAAFDAYRADPAHAGLGVLRSSVIAATEVLVGEEGPTYRPAGAPVDPLT